MNMDTNDLVNSLSLTPPPSNSNRMLKIINSSAQISPAALLALNLQDSENRQIPIYCGLHGQPLDFFCIDD